MLHKKIGYIYKKENGTVYIYIYIYIMQIQYLALISYRSGFTPKDLCEITAR